MKSVSWLKKLLEALASENTFIKKPKTQSPNKYLSYSEFVKIFFIF